jgi:hypothetical protein
MSPAKIAKRFILHFLLIFFLMTAGALQLFPASVELELRSAQVNGQLVSHILMVTNRTAESFRGQIIVNVPEGVRPLSQEGRMLDLAPGDSCFIAYRLQMTRDIEAGEKVIYYTLQDEGENEIDDTSVVIAVPRRERLTLMTDNRPYILTNPDDSVRISVTINNSGNVTEEVILVFNVPNLRNGSSFTEVTAILAPGAQRTLTHSFMPSSNLLQAVQFPVHITGMKGREKKLFDSKSITVQSVITQRSYNPFDRDQLLNTGNGSTDNGVALSYRQYSNTSSMLQLQGGSYIDLPAGYLHLKGNLYQYDSQRSPILTNTSLTYRINESEVILGNVSQQAELSLFGRGTKLVFSDKMGLRSVTLGAIDQNYNLIGSQPWFSEYYSFFVNGEIGTEKDRVKSSATYIYQHNPYEKADYHLSSLDGRYAPNANWQLEMKVHGAMGRYEEMDGNRYSGAGEMRYSGKLFEKMSLNGSAYYSDPYFPGSRKGTLSISQGASLRLSDYIGINSSFSYNRTEPRSYRYDYNYRSENNYGNFSLSLPPFSNFSSSLFYQFQQESSPSYSRSMGTGYEGMILTMTSHRAGIQWRWQNGKVKHSLYGSLEGGSFLDPIVSQWTEQGKVSLNYAFGEFTSGISWQQGAYYLYEQVMAQQQQRPFTRLTLSAAINHDFSKKFTLSSGFNFIRDINQGEVPSATINARYIPRINLSFFLNGYWYKYPYMQNKDIINVEMGLQYNFKKGEPLKGRKSALIAKVYYDQNANNRFDKGDELAKGYLIDIDRKAFISDKKGEVRYTSVPFGTYTVKPVRTGQWTFDQKEIEMKSFKTNVEIPLRQSGTLRGSIRYESGENSVEISPRYEGFRLIITGSDEKVVQTVVTDGSGSFITFLPVGEYKITLDKNTLMEHTQCKDLQRSFRIEAGKVNRLDPFVIEVKTRKVNVRKFFQANR